MEGRISRTGYLSVLALNCSHTRTLPLQNRDLFYPLKIQAAGEDLKNQFSIIIFRRLETKNIHCIKNKNSEHNGKMKEKSRGRGFNLLGYGRGRRMPLFSWIQLGGGGGSFRLNTAKNEPSGFKSKHLNFFFRIC